ncbi:hypothetical protein GCM10009526_26040 [Glutamicibacter creatinolyticus]
MSLSAQFRAPKSEHGNRAEFRASSRQGRLHMLRRTLAGLVIAALVFTPSVAVADEQLSSTTPTAPSTDALPPSQSPEAQEPEASATGRCYSFAEPCGDPDRS